MLNFFNNIRLPGSSPKQERRNSTSRTDATSWVSPVNICQRGQLTFATTALIAISSSSPAAGRRHDSAGGSALLEEFVAVKASCSSLYPGHECITCDDHVTAILDLKAEHDASLAAITAKLKAKYKELLAASTAKLKGEHEASLAKSEAKLKSAMDDYNNLQEDYAYEICKLTTERDDARKSYEEERIDYAKLNVTKNDLSNENKDLSNECRDLSVENRQLKDCNEKLKGRLQELEALHVKSIKNVGAGLEPITDDAFTKRFRELCDEVRSSHCIVLISMLFTHIIVDLRLLPQRIAVFKSFSQPEDFSSLLKGI